MNGDIKTTYRMIDSCVFWCRCSGVHANKKQFGRGMAAAQRLHDVLVIPLTRMQFGLGSSGIFTSDSSMLGPAICEELNDAEW